MNNSNYQSFVNWVLETPLINEERLNDYIDSWIDVWHYCDENIMNLHEHLGFTEEEYALFVANPNSLRDILNKYKNEKT